MTVVLDVENSSNKTIKLLSGIARLRAGSFSASLRLQGLYWSLNGTAILYSTHEESTQSVVELVRAMPDNITFTEAKAIYDDVYRRELSEYSLYGDVAHNCDYQMFVQFSPVAGMTRQELDELENELERPTGISLPKPPQPIAQAIMFSPNCSVSVSSQGKHIVGIRIEPYLWKAAHYALASSVVLLLQIILLIRQIEHTPTPSSLSKVSYYTIAMQAVLDCYLCMLHLTGSVFYTEIYLSFAAVSFLTFVLLAMFDMRYLVMVWSVQRPEAGDTSTASGRRELWLIYFRFYVVLILGLFVLYMYSES
ncbi:hypothetical protein GGI12_006400, partial [Dipsacomyces acuminosporus]